MKAVVFSTTIVIFLFILGASNTFACSCDLPIGNRSLEKQIKKAYKQSAAVFSGEVEEIVKNPNTFSVKVKFKSASIYKGDHSKEITISTGRGGGDCGFIFEIGESYLVYAYGDLGSLHTNICQRTSSIRETEDVKVLDKIKKRKTKSFPKRLEQSRSLSYATAKDERGLRLNRLKSFSLRL